MRQICITQPYIIQRPKKRMCAFSTIFIIKEYHLIHKKVILLWLIGVKCNYVRTIQVYSFGERQELYRFCLLMINPCNRMQPHDTQQ